VRTTAPRRPGLSGQRDDAASSRDNRRANPSAQSLQASLLAAAEGVTVALDAPGAAWTPAQRQALERAVIVLLDAVSGERRRT
jgi:hypothetical protein